MPVHFRIVEQEFRNVVNNGLDFSLNGTNFSTAQLGNAGDRIQVTTQVEYGAWTELRSWVFQLKDGDTKARITMQGGKFDELFGVGDLIALTWDIGGTLATGSGTILSVVPDEVYISIDSDVETTFPDSNDRSDFKYNTGEKISYLTNIQAPTGVEYKYNFIENDSPINFANPLNSTELVYRFPSVTGLTVHDGERVGINKAGYSGSCTCQYVGTADDDVIISPSPHFKQYEFVHVVDVPYYRDGEIDSLRGEEAPPEEFEGASSLKYVLEVSFFTNIIDASSKKSQTFDSKLGSFGYFGESFNGFNTPYSISNVSYEDASGNAVDQLSTNEEVTINFTLSDSGDNLNTNTKIVVYHSALVDSQDYNYSTLDNPTLFTRELVRLSDSDGVVTNSFLTADVTDINASEMDVSVTVNFTATETARLSQGQEYTIWVAVQDEGENLDNGNLTSLIIDQNVYSKNTDIDGLLDFGLLGQLPHPYDYSTFAATTWATNGKFNVAEKVLTGLKFSVDTTTGATIEAINFNFALVNTAATVFDENTYIPIRSLSVDISDSVITSDGQKISLDSTRGYVLPDGDQFNYLKLDTVEKVSDDQYYELLVGWTVPYQSWVEWRNAPKDFYDNTLPFNGLNQFAANYSSQNHSLNYEWRVVVEVVMRKDGVNTSYVKSSEEFLIFGYDVDDQGTPPDTFECEIQTFSNGVPLNKNIIKGRDCLLRSTFTPDTPPVFSASVDFTEVDTDWGRFAHGEYLADDGFPGNNYRYDPTDDTTGWANGQADDDDVFTYAGGELTKGDAGLYSSTPTSILSNQNASAYYGVYSLLDYDFYELEGTMYSTEPDDDALGYVIAFHTDEFGIEHTLSLVVTTGGFGLGVNPEYVAGSPNFYQADSLWGLGRVGAAPKTGVRWALVYNYGKATAKQVYDGVHTGETGLNFDDVGDIDFSCVRNENDITVDISLTANGNPYSETINYTLGDDTETEIFQGGSRIGFAFLSQASGGFKDVILTQPNSDYYGINIILPKNAPQDQSSVASSTLRGVANGQIIGESTLEWNGTSFIIESPLDETLTEEGQEYNFIAQIRRKDLIS